MFKKLIASIILACFIFVNVGGYFASADKNVVHAQANTWYYQDWPDWTARVYNPDNPDEIFGERYTAAQVEWVIYGLIAFILNHIVGNAGLVGCVVREAWVGTQNWGACVPLLQAAICTLADANVFPEPPGFCGGATNTKEGSRALAAANPVQDILSGARPISGIGYLRSAASKFNLVSEVKAQGFGFEASSSMRTLWVAVRNVTYFILILMIIGMAFLIMFRFKISPQTVITVQSALPKIIIALLLITFSYAIAGFMIDLLYVVIGIIAGILSSSGLFNLGWADMYNRITGVSWGGGLIGLMLVYFLLFAITGLVATLSLDIINVLFALLSIIILIVVLIALVFITFKIMWMLIKAFVNVLLLIAMGPIYIITGGFTGWLKNLASNLAVFATIGPMFAISFLFMGAAIPDDPVFGGFFSLFQDIIPFRPIPNAITGSTWVPPFLAIGNMNYVWLFVSFVIITLIPNVANMIKGAVQGKPFGYGTAIGAALGGAAAVAWSPFGTTGSYMKDSFMKERASNLIGTFSRSKYGQALKRFGI